jgi:hypothetical protein
MNMQYNLHQVENVRCAHRDAKLKKEVCEALCHEVAHEAELLEVRVDNGQVLVSHPAPDWRLRKAIQACLAHIDGVLAVDLLRRSHTQGGGLHAPQWI